MENTRSEDVIYNVNIFFICGRRRKGGIEIDQVELIEAHEKR